MTMTTAPPRNLLAQIAEDFRTHDRDPFQPGFWAIAVHRIGHWAAGVRPPLIREPLRRTCTAMFTAVDWLWGIHLPPSVELGRRVRIWHHGCMWLTARSIGDDVQIRQNTTLGPVRGESDDPATWPTIGSRVQLASGVCVLGDVTIGHDSIVGANSVVLRSFPPESRVLGAPARPIPS